MKTFLLSLRLYYWKEWRDHRAIVIGFLIAMPVLLGLAGALLERRMFQGRGLQLFVVGASLLVGALAIGADLVPGEARRGKLDFLRRLPCDLHHAYLGKLAFLLSVYVLFPAYGHGVAWVVGRAVGGDATAAVVLPARMVGGGLAVVLWAFVVSCWLPRGALAVPAALLVLGLFALPVVLACLRYPALDPQAGVWLGVLAVGAPVVGWWSFAGGRRFGRGIGASAWRGLLALALLFAPAYGHTAVGLHDLFHLDPRDRDFAMEAGWLGEGGRYAFVNVTAHGANHAIVIDLNTGEWRRDGDVGDYFSHPAPARLAHASRARTPLPLVRRTVRAQHGPMGDWCTYLDGATAKPVKSGWSAMRLDEIEPHLQKLAPVPQDFRPRGAAGLGLYGQAPRGSERIHDPFRGRTYPYSRHQERYHIRVRPGLWIVRGRWDRHYFLFDPDTKVTSPVRGGVTLTTNFSLLDDGRALDGSVVLEPETGELLRLESADTAVLARTPNGAQLLRVGHRLARLAGSEIAYADGVAGSEFTVVGVPDEETALVICNRKHLVRVRFGSTAREVLFPR
jgi:hypothetical protein